MTRLLITLTAAEWASVQPDGTLWIVREAGWPKACPLADPTACNGEHCDCPLGPPVEFVQACAPCETCHDEGVVFNGVDYHPCPDCRIELVGPCEIDGCRWSPHRTLGYAYAIGQPLPIVNDTLGTGDCMIVDPDGDMWVLIDGVYDEPITAALAHYGPPETLVGRWAMQLRVVGP